MSLGSPKIVVRVPQELLDIIEDCVAGHNLHTRGKEIGVSEWIRAAICEKVAKTRRGQKRVEPTKRVIVNDRLEMNEE